jgi:hypothetical protein
MIRQDRGVSTNCFNSYMNSRPNGGSTSAGAGIDARRQRRRIFPAHFSHGTGVGTTIFLGHKNQHSAQVQTRSYWGIQRMDRKSVLKLGSRTRQSRHRTWMSSPCRQQTLSPHQGCPLDCRTNTSPGRNRFQLQPPGREPRLVYMVNILIYPRNLAHLYPNPHKKTYLQFLSSVFSPPRDMPEKQGDYYRMSHKCLS